MVSGDELVFHPIIHSSNNKMENSGDVPKKKSYDFEIVDVNNLELGPSISSNRSSSS